MSPSIAYAVIACFLFGMRSTAAQGTWYTGRASNYGGPSDGWSIHQGSCEYGYLDPNHGTGWDVAALSDTDGDFVNSCGRCYEVACQPMSFTDNYGQKMDRNNACKDTSASVVVQITDACQCNYAPNAYSNKRWCCGDMYHMDMSIWAFEKLANPSNGVIGMKYRVVPCDYKPAKPATTSSPTAGQSPPSGWNPSMDHRPLH